MKETATSLGDDVLGSSELTAIDESDGTHIDFNGIGASHGDEKQAVLEAAWQATEAMKPEALVVNMGLN